MSNSRGQEAVGAGKGAGELCSFHHPRQHTWASRAHPHPGTMGTGLANPALGTAPQHKTAPGKHLNWGFVLGQGHGQVPQHGERRVPAAAWDDPKNPI